MDITVPLHVTLDKRLQMTNYGVRSKRPCVELLSHLEAVNEVKSRQLVELQVIELDVDDATECVVRPLREHTSEESLHVQVVDEIRVSS